MPISTLTVFPADALPSPLIPRRRGCRRCLFETPDGAAQESNGAFVKRLLDEMREAQSRKWGFDFVANEPIANDENFVYKRVDEASVPGFYRMLNYAPQLPPAGSFDEQDDMADSYDYDKYGVVVSRRVRKYLELNHHHGYASYNSHQNNEDDEPLTNVKEKDYELEVQKKISNNQSQQSWNVRHNVEHRLNGSFEDIESSFDEYDQSGEDDEPLFNDSTSSSSSSEIDEKFTEPVAASCKLSAAESEDSSLIKLFDISQETSMEQDSFLDSDEDPETETSILSTKRRSIEAAVTPKKQTRITEFMTRRKRMQMDEFGKVTKIHERTIITAKRRHAQSSEVVDGESCAKRATKRGAPLPPDNASAPFKRCKTTAD